MEQRAHANLIRPPVSMRIVAACILVPAATFLFVIAVGAIVQNWSNWPSTVVLLAVAAAVALILINTLASGIATEDGMLVIHGLRRKKLPLSSVATLRMTRSKYPGLQLLGFVGSGGQILCQLPPIWDVNNVTSWAARAGIQFEGELPPKGVS